MLKTVKPSDLEQFVLNNTVFDMRPLFNQIPKPLRSRINEIVENNKILLDNFITGEKLISKAKEKRPDLFRVLSTYKGRIWTENFLKYIKKSVFDL